MKISCYDRFHPKIWELEFLFVFFSLQVVISLCALQRLDNICNLAFLTEKDSILTCCKKNIAKLTNAAQCQKWHSQSAVGDKVTFSAVRL